MKNKVLLFLLICTQIVFANEILDVWTTPFAKNKTQVHISFKENVSAPSHFSLVNPNSIIVDFKGTSSKSLPSFKASQTVEQGLINKLLLVQSEDKSRMIIDLSEFSPYELSVLENKVVITVDPNINLNKKTNQSNVEFDELVEDLRLEQAFYSLNSIDFRRGDKGEAKLIIDLSTTNVSADFRTEGEKVVLELFNSKVGAQLQKKFDVLDFATPMKNFTVRSANNNVRIEIDTVGIFDKLAYQNKNQFIVELTPLTEQEAEELRKQRFQFSGDKISLHFQDIDVRSVLQILADFTNLNMITTDSVQGNITIKLDDIPWDQALDFILKSKGLSKTEEGNILLIAPSEEIAEREKVQLETQKAVSDLAPLQTEYIKIKYATAESMVSFIKGDSNSLLSERGNISADTRTNTLLIQDTATKLSEIRKLLDKLDVPIKQVLVELHLVTSTSNIVDELGFKTTGAGRLQVGRRKLGIAKTPVDALTMATTGIVETASRIALDAFSAALNDSEGLNMGFALTNLPGGTLLDLELKALEKEEKTNVISRPKLLTLDRKEATITQGEEIPYTVTTGTGADATTTVEFKPINLSFSVTPEISPDNFIKLDLNVTADEKGPAASDGTPTANTKSLTTSVLVENGETIVLAGIFRQEIKDGTKVIPYLHKLPLLGRLFKTTDNSNERSETMMFVTPRIVDSNNLLN